jgi:hypothetical protein
MLVGHTVKGEGHPRRGEGGNNSRGRGMIGEGGFMVEAVKVAAESAEVQSVGGEGCKHMCGGISGEAVA